MIDHRGWTDWHRGQMRFTLEDNWMSKHDDTKPGDLTPQDLRDALRVNRALEHRSPSMDNALVVRIGKNLDRGLIIPREALFQLIELWHQAKITQEQLDEARKELGLNGDLDS